MCSTVYGTRVQKTQTFAWPIAMEAPGMMKPSKRSLCVSAETLVDNRRANRLGDHHYLVSAYGGSGDR